MAGQGLDVIPLRVPEKWDAVWFETFVRDVLALADVRNAVEGSGISVEGTSDGPATLAASADVLAILTASLITVTAPPAALTQARVLEAGNGITITDGGAGDTITISATAPLWYDIEGVPIYVTSPAAPAWDFRVGGAVVGYVGVATVAGDIATGSLAGDLVLAPSAAASRVYTRSDLWLNVDGATVPAAAVNPDARLVIVDDVAFSIEFVKAGDASGSLGLRCIAAGGTFALPTAITTLNTSYMGFVGGSGHDGTNWQTASAGLIGIRPVDTWSGTQRPTRVTIETTPLLSTTRSVVASFDQAAITLTATALTLTGASSFVGAIIATSAAGAVLNGWSVNLTNTNPGIAWRETDGGVNAKAWDLRVSTEVLIGELWLDDYSVARRWLQVNRSAGAVSQIAFGNATDRPPIFMNGPLKLSNLETAILTNADNPILYSTNGIGAGDFATAGTLYIQPRTSAARDIVMLAGTTSPTERMRIFGATNKVSIAGVLLLADGAVGAPSYSFTNDPDTGFYSVGSNQFNVASGGVFVMSLSASALGLRSAIPLQLNNAANDAAMTILNAGGAGAVRLSVVSSATERFALLTDAALARDGTGANPGYGFISDPDLGIYRIGADSLGIAGGAVDLATFSTTEMVASRGRVSFGNQVSALVTNFANPLIYSASGSGSGDFANAGTLFIQPRSSAARDIVFLTGTTSPLDRLRISGSTGQVTATVGITITNTAGVELLLIDGDSSTGTQQVAVRNSGGLFRIISRDDAGVFVENLLAATLAAGSLWNQLTISADVNVFDAVGASLVVGHTSNPFGGIAALGTGSGAFLSSARYTTGASQPASIQLNKSRTATIGAHTIMQSGDSVGAVNAYASDGTAYVIMAGVHFEVDGTPGVNDMPGRIVFYVTPDGSNALVEAARISNDKVALFRNYTNGTVFLGSYTPGSFTIEAGRYGSVVKRVQLTTTQRATIQGLTGRLRIRD